MKIGKRMEDRIRDLLTLFEKEVKQGGYSASVRVATSAAALEIAALDVSDLRSVLEYLDEKARDSRTFVAGTQEAYEWVLWDMEKIWACMLTKLMSNLKIKYSIPYYRNGLGALVNIIEKQIDNKTA